MLHKYHHYSYTQGVKAGVPKCRLCKMTGHVSTNGRVDALSIFGELYLDIIRGSCPNTF